MKEKPIPFSAWKMSRVLAMPGEGITEMATMRPMKPQPIFQDGLWKWSKEGARCSATEWLLFQGHLTLSAPYRVGDILWPREPWRADSCWDPVPPSQIVSRSGGLARISYEADNAPERYLWGKLRPGMYLPKAFARPNRYEVLRVEARRPQELTDAEIIAEGIETGNLGPGCAASLLRVKWMNKWSETYSRISWELNPWCWRITFSEVRQELP